MHSLYLLLIESLSIYKTVVASGRRKLKMKLFLAQHSHVENQLPVMNAASIGFEEVSFSNSIISKNFTSDAFCFHSKNVIYKIKINS